MNEELSPREIEIIFLISEGLDYKEIAEKLFLSHTTIASHKKRILKKANAKNAAHLVKIAMLNKYI
ncbi:hypothetical protein BH11BAC1_BH11BAC1_23740 [soil metagenome]